MLIRVAEAGDIEVVELTVGEISGLDIPRILFNIRQIKDKKQVVGLEVAEL